MRERLPILGAEILELRRLKADLMYIYKMLHGLVNVEPTTLDIKLKGGSSTRFGTHCMHSAFKRSTAESIKAEIF